MRYYYRKIGNTEKYIKVTVDDSFAGTKEEPFKIIDAEIVDKIEEKETLIYNHEG